MKLKFEQLKQSWGTMCYSCFVAGLSGPRSLCSDCMHRHRRHRAGLVLFRQNVNDEIYGPGIAKFALAADGHTCGAFLYEKCDYDWIKL